ncbi:MAG: FAD-dependent oxidoreductase [Bacillota bacterium]|nr:FAD-dependent oxidoreductase [Bacillota bacterium]
MEFFEIVLKEIRKETSDSYSYIFNIPEGYTFKAGQHAAWKFKDHKVEEGDRDTRVFSIASAPEDGYLMFTTRIADPHTSYKEILLNKIKVGDSMFIAPARGDFNFQKDHTHTFVIAGGIGITPIRSILKTWAHQNDLNHKIEVLYSDDRGEFCYKEAFDEITAAMPNLTLSLISQREVFMERVDEFAKANGNHAEYLVAGSPGMNKAFKERLMGMGISEDNIKLDNFIGY